MRCWVDGSDRLSPGLGRGSRSFGGDRRRSQPRPEARGAGSDHLGLGRPADRRRGRQTGRARPAGGMALAGALRRGRRRGPAARCHPQARQSAPGRPRRGSDRDPDLCRAARRSHPLDRPGDGQTHGRLPALGAARGWLRGDLGGRPWEPAAGLRTTFSRTASGPSSARPIPSSRPSSRTSPACTSTRPSMLWSCRSTRNPRSRPSTAPSPGCRSSQARPGP